MNEYTKADLHVHSKYSKRPSQWVLQKIGCPESYSEPIYLYRKLTELGMDLVTITDHNSIAGSLEIAHLPNTFVSEEITTYFPDDRCKIHVLAYDLIESQHVDIQHYRDNIFDLVGYLQVSRISHAVAHPLFSINDRLTSAHFEQLLLLFKNFEVNGSRDSRMNTILVSILDLLDSKDIERLENVHDRHAACATPWKKNIIGGSDDHSSLTLAQTYTSISGKLNSKDFLRSIEDGYSQSAGQSSTPELLSANLYSIAYQYYKNRFNLSRHINKDILLKFIDRNLSPEQTDDTSLMGSIHALFANSIRPRSRKSASEGLEEVFRHEIAKIIWADPELMSIVRSSSGEKIQPGETWFHFVNRSANEVLKQSANNFFRKISEGKIFDIFHAIGCGGALYTLLAPYFISYSLFSNDRRFSADTLDSFRTAKGLDSAFESRIIRVAHFTDTFHEVNGVALTLKQLLRVARGQNKDMTIITCSLTEQTQRTGVVNFQPIGEFKLPEYPELRMYYPPVLEILRYCFDTEISHIHTATPGPVGLAALAVARLLRLPIYGTYHTALPQYAQHLTQDFALEDMTWRYMIWYYNQLDQVFAPSHATARELIGKGVAPHKVVVYPRGIDTTRFHPSKRNGFFASRYDLGEGFKFLYVGRVSKEKNLPMLESAFLELARKRPNAKLVIVGDGPYREQMEYNLRGAQALFTGYLDGDDLAQAYASADAFVFPSNTDTFGNVVFEAQSSGLPVIVSSKGGPQENVLHGQTGLIVTNDSLHAYVEAFEKLMDNESLRQRMKVEARRFMEGRSFDSSLQKVWSYYEREPVA